MIGLPEILILVVIALIVFGGYKRLPALGRSAGKGARVGAEKVKELAGTASEKAQTIDTSKIARSAGESMRDVREVRDAVKGVGDTKSSSSSSSSGKPTSSSKPTSSATSTKGSDSSE